MVKIGRANRTNKPTIAGEWREWRKRESDVLWYLRNAHLHSAHHLFVTDWWSSANSQFKRIKSNQINETWIQIFSDFFFVLTIRPYQLDLAVICVIDANSSMTVRKIESKIAVGMIWWKKESEYCALLLFLLLSNFHHPIIPDKHERWFAIFRMLFVHSASHFALLQLAAELMMCLIRACTVNSEQCTRISIFRIIVIEFNCVSKWA